MAKDENGGLFSKVVKFVRNPTTNWSDLDQAESSRESTYSKQALKEMIERKRRNDFVRKREFDMLRKMRRREALTGADLTARPSFFQSSMPSKPDDRAMTIKKIDEIEAQMSMQWWKTKNGEKGDDSSGRGMVSGSVSSSGPDTDGQPLSPQAHAASYAATDPAPLGGMPPTNGAAARVPLSGGRMPTFDSGIGSFSMSKVEAIEVDEIAHDPELEEAAIRFANGDDAGAEAGLLEALGDNGTRSRHEDTWMTLFDLYRATGQQPRFESAAEDFVNRFGRSAPQWYSMPDVVSNMAAPPESSPAAQPAHWTSPLSLGVQTVVTMNAVLNRAAPPWRLDWSKLAVIEPAALAPLHKLFQTWGSQPVQLRFVGAERLDELLAAATPSGDKAVDPAWWRLRMESLRITQRAEDFELAALNYCVTYEVSPPSWESARCDYKPLGSDGGYVPGHTIFGDVFRNSGMAGMGGQTSDFGATSMDSMAANFAKVELSGQVLGDATEALKKLDAKTTGADIIVIACARLIRVDFSAAGNLLNWVSARQAEGRQVQFVEVPRLVAAFFNVIGISESARVSSRAE